MPYITRSKNEWALAKMFIAANRQSSVMTRIFSVPYLSASVPNRGLRTSIATELTMK